MEITSSSATSALHRHCMRWEQATYVHIWCEPFRRRIQASPAFCSPLRKTSQSKNYANLFQLLTIISTSPEVAKSWHYCYLTRSESWALACWAVLRPRDRDLRSDTMLLGICFCPFENSPDVISLGTWNHNGKRPALEVSDIFPSRSRSLRSWHNANRSNSDTLPIVLWHYTSWVFWSPNDPWGLLLLIHELDVARLSSPVSS